MNDKLCLSEKRAPTVDNTRSSAVAETPRYALCREIRIRGRLRSLETVPISTADTSSY